ncbi:ATP11-domain-containing protein [Suillus fuscotomentosus]|uniref:ATP11-domain-containing protein n=1 Tax=Suillus fuscotomentosus TaxID=1912939 RepID=A0AAD4ELV9_9AGAM|nr:ATP11-domain-containing protein [Suillus fuscotomentosus]KAG1908496.1 ATP11-domain-containing protein [Suillus fuscotomentosus]
MLWLQSSPATLHLHAIVCRRSAGRYFAVARWIHAGPSTPLYESKYAERLQQKAQEQGLELTELRTRAKEAARRKEVANVKSARLSQAHPQRLNKSPSEMVRSKVSGTSGVRKDSSPVKALESIINVQRLMSTPHTAEQISALWTTYHASRTAGTGRGFICASVPIKLYNRMLAIGKQYPMFVIPVPREGSSAVSPEGQESAVAHEFYFLQWDFHAPPLPPSATGPDLFSRVPPSNATALPQTATVLFTPLQEYKLRQSFATPYLILTFYPDFAQTHGIVLLRGEITPSAATAAATPSPGTPAARFLLSQIDAQLLAMGVQKFYLWGNESEDSSQKGDQKAEKLLRQFHERPEEFNWADLLEHARLTS